MESKIAQKLMKEITFIKFMKLLRIMPWREWMKGFTENRFWNLLARLLSIAALIYYLGNITGFWDWWAKSRSFKEFTKSKNYQAYT